LVLICRILSDLIETKNIVTGLRHTVLTVFFYWATIWQYVRSSRVLGSKGKIFKDLIKADSNEKLKLK